MFVIGQALAVSLCLVVLLRIYEAKLKEARDTVVPKRRKGRPCPRILKYL